MAGKPQPGAVRDYRKLTGEEQAREVRRRKKAARKLRRKKRERGREQWERASMELWVHTVGEARMVSYAALTLLRGLGRKKGHDTQSCACDLCKPSRLLAEVVQRLAAAEQEEMREARRG